jgi:peptide/nickel transport system permease protein
MFIYVAKRLALAIAVLVVIAFLLIALVTVVPGDPARTVLGTHATPELMRQVRQTMGLDEPVWEQTWNFLWGALHGDLGTDFITRAPVRDELGRPFVNTLVLSLASMVLAAAIGIPAGVVSAVNSGGVVDRIVRAVSMVLLSTPVYVVGLVLLLVLSVHFHWLPSLGGGSFSDPLDYARRLLMPAFALAVYWIAYLARLVRSSMLEVLEQDYVRTSRAYGVPEATINFRVALRNALVPIVALLGLMLGYTLAGTVYVEQIFGRVGLGSLALSSIGNRDWPVVRGVVLIYAVAFVLGSLLADVAYRVLDPRLRVEQDAGVFV